MTQIKMLLVNLFYMTILMQGCLSSECSCRKLEEKLLQLEKRLLVQEQLNQLPKQSTNIESQLNQLGLEINSSADTSQQKRLKRAAETVAFTAYLDHDVYHVGADQVYPFNKVVTNIGGNFNPNTHVFTCSVAGLYHFSFFIAAGDANEVVARLVVDGDNIVGAIADTTQTGFEIQGSNTALIELHSGQSVWVSNYKHSEIHLRSTSTFRYVTFSGVLIEAY